VIWSESGSAGTFLALYINWRKCQNCRTTCRRIAAYEEPHASAEASGSESVERADGVDVDGVGAVGSTGTSGTSHCVWAQSERGSRRIARSSGRAGCVREGRWSIESSSSSRVRVSDGLFSMGLLASVGFSCGDGHDAFHLGCCLTPTRLSSSVHRPSDISLRAYLASSHPARQARTPCRQPSTLSRAFHKPC
jgi:hypothetical protein